MAYLGRKGQTAPLASADLPTNSISTAHLINDAVTSAKIGVDVIVAEDIANNAITVAEIADDAVTADKLANSINTDIATGVAALPKAGGTMTGAVTGMTGLTGGTGDFNWDSNTLVVDSSESRVGVGDSSPNAKLHIASGTANTDGVLIGDSTAAEGAYYWHDGSTTTSYIDVIFNHDNADLAFRTKGTTERMRIKGSGNVGIGTSSMSGGTGPATSLQIAGDFDGSNTYAGTGSNKGLTITKTSGGYAGGESFGVVFEDHTNRYPIAGVMARATEVGSYVGGALHLQTKEDSDSLLQDRVVIDPSGAVLIGKTSYSSSGSGLYLLNDVYNGGRIAFTRVDNSNTQYNMSFYTFGGTKVGEVTTTASATAYVTSSDYRLKENVVAMSGSIDRLKSLKPSRFNFIADADKTVDGFLAHEAQEVVPESVSGEKDAMTEAVLYVEGDELPEGKSIGDVKTAERIDPQGIDQSKLVPLLVGALQEAIARIETLENA